MAKRKYLLIVCHDPSQPWLIEPDTKQNFELWYYNYTGEPLINEETKRKVNIAKTFKDNYGITISKVIETKMLGKGQIFRDLCQYAFEQKYVGIFDGDCKTEVSSINHLFETGDQERWEWFQPAMREGSYFSHGWTMENYPAKYPYQTKEGNEYNLTPFVEIMCPVFSVDLWDFLRPMHQFYDYISGYGLDNALVPACLPYYSDITFPIVYKGATIQHTKPVSDANTKLANKLTAYQEMDYVIGFASEVAQSLYRDDVVYNVSSFCISLKESTERQKRFKAKAEANCLDFNFFAALDFRGFKPEDYPEWVTRNGKRVDWHLPLTPGEVGCAASHKLLYEIGLTHEDYSVDALAIFEDDCLVQQPINVEIPVDADMLMLSGRWFHNAHHEVIGASCGTEAYIITRQGMYKMLQILQNMDMPLDLIMIAHCQSMIEFGHGLCSVRNPLNPVLKIYHYETLCAHDDSQQSTLHS